MRFAIVGGSLAALTAVGGIILTGCASSSSTCADDVTCAPSLLDASADANGSGNDGGLEASVPPPAGCDPTADPKDAPLCVVSAYGVFVDAAHGSDSGNGTPDTPFRTVTHALTQLASKPRIYVCEGSYAEAINLTTPVSIYGGFACGTWSYSGNKAAVTPQASGAAITVKGTSSDVVLADLSVTAANGQTPAESSIGLFASNASKLTLRRMTVGAGSGAHGAPGNSVPDFNANSAPSGANGGSGAAAGVSVANPTCLTSIGGAGGDWQNKATDNGIAGQVATAIVYPANATGNGGIASTGNCNGGSSGNPGGFGPAGMQANGATSLGVLSAEGWSPANGADGGKGVDGQGGGGGARIAGQVAGGGGGAGRCGGSGGGRGGGGGGSIAIASFQTMLVIEDGVALSTAASGDGGAGGKGQKAQLGGLGGTFPNPTQACNGGPGGAGGSGAGGGAGGISVGVLYSGTPPLIRGQNMTDAETSDFVTLGAKGNVGPGGSGGDAAQTAAPASYAGPAGKDGVDGIAKAVMAAP